MSLDPICGGVRSFCCVFFFNDTATTEIYTLSLHDALPICAQVERVEAAARGDVAVAGAGAQAALHVVEDHGAVAGGHFAVAAQTVRAHGAVAGDEREPSLERLAVHRAVAVPHGEHALLRNGHVHGEMFVDAADHPDEARTLRRDPDLVALVLEHHGGLAHADHLAPAPSLELDVSLHVTSRAGVD